jgi:DNA-binding NtrC family response regulator
MPSGRLLVVAPHPDLRGSLVFALEAEGFEVTARDQLPTMAWMSERRFDCCVLDQKALTGEAYESIAFCIKAHPVVLMAARPHQWLVEWCSQVVVTPAADDAMQMAVRLAIQIQG